MYGTPWKQSWDAFHARQLIPDEADIVGSQQRDDQERGSVQATGWSGAGICPRGEERLREENRNGGDEYMTLFIQWHLGLGDATVCNGLVGVLSSLLCIRVGGVGDSK